MLPTLIVTRPIDQATDWVERLRALGLNAHALPLLRIEPAADPAPLWQTWAQIEQFTLLMFVSANAVLQFFAQRPPAAAGPWPGTVLAAATGPGTAAALRRLGVPAACLVEPAPELGQFDSEALWKLLKARPWAGRRVRVLRGEDGRDWLADRFREAGAQVEFVATYRRQAALLDAPGQALLHAAQTEPAAHLWLLSSSAALATLAIWAPGADWSRSSAWVTHPRIADAARERGFGLVAAVGLSPQAVAAQLSAWPSIQSAPL